MTPKALDTQRPLEADMPHTPPAFVPPVDATHDELEWQWGYKDAVEMVGWDWQWTEFAVAAEGRRANRRLHNLGESTPGTSDEAA